MGFSPEQSENLARFMQSGASPLRSISYYSYMVYFMQALRECEGHAPHDLDLRSQPSALALLELPSSRGMRRMSTGRGGLGVRGRPRWSIQAEARPRQTGRGALSGAPDCACAGRRSATSGAGVRAERPASLSMPLRGNEASKITALKVSLGSPACRGPVQGGTLPHPSGAWEGARALADKPAHGYAGRRLAPAADAVGKAAALRSWHAICKVYIF